MSVMERPASTDSEALGLSSSKLAPGVTSPEMAWGVGPHRRTRPGSCSLYRFGGEVREAPKSMVSPWAQACDPCRERPTP